MVILLGFAVTAVVVTTVVVKKRVVDFVFGFVVVFVINFVFDLVVDFFVDFTLGLIDDFEVDDDEKELVSSVELPNQKS